MAQSFKTLALLFIITALIFIGCTRRVVLIVPEPPHRPAINFEFDEKQNRVYLKAGNEKDLQSYLEKQDAYRDSMLKLLEGLK